MREDLKGPDGVNRGKLGCGGEAEQDGAVGLFHGRRPVQPVRPLRKDRHAAPWVPVAPTGFSGW
ncbi:hypothetical protein GCM10027200_52360 [Lentzea nigeriaca]